MTEDAPRRLSLLYQLFVAHQATRRFMRLALAGSDMSGEEYALFSYLFANGPRSLSQAARDLGWPVTTLSTMLAPLMDGGKLRRIPHPRDRRSRLLDLTDAGRERLEAAIPGFTVAHRRLNAELATAGVEPGSIGESLAALQAAVERTTELLGAEVGDVTSPDDHV